MNTATMTSKGQLLIPKNLRVKYEMKPGEKIMFNETAEGLLLQPLNEDFFDRYCGMLAGEAPTKQEYLQWKKSDVARENKTGKRKTVQK